ncbi:MAG: SHOCT domain-containing protein [Bacillota bacterium]
MFNGFHNGGFGFYGGGSIMMIIFWVFIIFAAFWLYNNWDLAGNSNNRNNQSGPHTQNYMEDKQDEASKIARRRYARGEIDKEELQEILRNLE